MTLTEHMIDTKLGRLHVEVDGEGPAAVLWHSLFVHSNSWSRLRGLLSDDRRLVRIDGLGHGKSGSPSTKFDLDDCADAATEVLDAVGVPKPVDWLGNAWGGQVGLVLAAKSPDWCRSVATIATPAQALSRRERMTIAGRRTGGDHQGVLARSGALRRTLITLIRHERDVCIIRGP